MNFHLNFGKFEGWKGRHFYGRPGRHLASLRHWFTDKG